MNNECKTNKILSEVAEEQLSSGLADDCSLPLTGSISEIRLCTTLNINPEQTSLQSSHVSYNSQLLHTGGATRMSGSTFLSRDNFSDLSDLTVGK